MSIVNTCSHLLDVILGMTCAEKLKMVLNVLFHEWHMHPPWLTAFHDEMGKISDDELDAVFRDIDPVSREQIGKYVSCQRGFPLTEENSQYFFFNYHKFFTDNERKWRGRVLRSYLRELKNYECDEKVLGGVESILHHHGLGLCCSAVRDYIRDGIFVDAGGCFGDSAMVFLRHYHPEKVITFEPAGSNRKIFCSTMRLNRIPESQYEVIPMGLGKKETSFDYVETSGGGNFLANRGAEGENVHVSVTTLDNFCRERDLANIKVIKADIEGMGLDMLLGAEEVIRKNRPVLLLSIYHNRDELLGIYDTLKKWDIAYHLEARLLGFPAYPGELTLIGYPEELDKGAPPQR